jgi:hypothetical protein
MWCVLLKLQGWLASCQNHSHNLARLKHLYQVDKKWEGLSCHTGPVYIINTTCTWNFRLGSTRAIDANLCIIWTSKFKLVKGMGSGLTNYLPTNITPNYLQASQNMKVTSKWVRDGKNSKEYETRLANRMKVQNIGVGVVLCSQVPCLVHKMFCSPLCTLRKRLCAILQTFSLTCLTTS